MKPLTPRKLLFVVGMHRSGTTMITNMLRALGLFTGWQLQHNSEAMFFVTRNEKLLNVCGGNWANPAPVDKLLTDDRRRRAKERGENRARRCHTKYQINRRAR